MNASAVHSPWLGATNNNEHANNVHEFCIAAIFVPERMVALSVTRLELSCSIYVQYFVGANPILQSICILTQPTVGTDPRLQCSLKHEEMHRLWKITKCAYANRKRKISADTQVIMHCSTYIRLYAFGADPFVRCTNARRSGFGFQLDVLDLDP